MEETLASPKMAEIDLINNLEKISSEIPNRILKLEGFILKKNQKETHQQHNLYPNEDSIQNRQTYLLKKESSQFH